MFFSIGVVLMIVGFVVINGFGSTLNYAPNGVDYFGAATFIVGFVMSLGSILVVASKYLP